MRNMKVTNILQTINLQSVFITFLNPKPREK